MTSTVARRSITVALLGNPNTGKSSLFTALAGVRQKVGNYPGVTIEKKLGTFAFNGCSLTVVDLPGTYSLAPRSPDEMVAVDVLFGREPGLDRPDVVLCIVDAANLDRNLYLVSQALELGLPTVVALNMIDESRRRGIAIDVAKLSERLGVPVVETQANSGLGVESLKQALVKASESASSTPVSPFPQPFQNEVEQLERRYGADDAFGPLPRYLAERLLLDTTGYLQGRLAPDGNGHLSEELRAARERLKSQGLAVPACEAISRYDWVEQMLAGIVERREQSGLSTTDRIDRILTHRVWGTLVFAAVMIVVFQAVFRWAVPLMTFIDIEVARVSAVIAEWLPAGPLESLIVDGLLAGVGGVIVFLPQILILFLFLAVLEDCGYMARAAYLMDRLMARVGLNGKSFIPLLSSFACAIPGVMATRVIENRRDRLTTILIAPLMTCSARLPVYTLMIAAFIPAQAYLGGFLQLQGLVMVAMYLVGVLAAVGMALLLKRTMLRGATPPFVMELPVYRMPSPKMVLLRMLERGWAFVKNAGTLIVAVSIIVWAALYYPHDAATVEAPYRAEREAAIAAENVDAVTAIDAHIDGAYKRQSYLGRLGHVMEPVVRPLGWDWRLGCAVAASFPAREVVVATLGILFDQGADVDVEDEASRGRLQSAMSDAKWEGTDRPLFTIATALSVMVFFALCAQCAATLAVIKRETNSWRWPAFTFCYMTALAYVAALVTYQTAAACGL